MIGIIFQLGNIIAFLDKMKALILIRGPFGRAYLFDVSKIKILVTTFLISIKTAISKKR
jgi:hypothetical protein